MYRFKTYRTVPQLRIHEISYAVSGRRAFAHVWSVRAENLVHGDVGKVDDVALRMALPMTLARGGPDEPVPVVREGLLPHQDRRTAAAHIDQLSHLTGAVGGLDSQPSLVGVGWTRT